ncbi:DNA topoisomerase III [Tindallia californiensis]|uniref:DNA topoisomerase 3 n=1 Tax=Tindallia californiensis TaxID=159292 RepID=A0A1H3LQJ3_9FIRM|nr:DNA topoisomerase III [Tindallia californiensis]SDY66369.1 DNA topoisomerase-3 [Tindallia californiensis]
MSKSFVLAEKPSVARDIARVLTCTRKGNGFLEGDKYVVSWALGHLVTLMDPEGYDKKYQQWRLEDLPILPKDLKLEVIRQSRQQYNAVSNQLKRKDIKEIIIATDAGREGELVARWILEKAGNRKPIKRLWISSVTDQAIRQGFQQLKEGKAYENLYASAVARSEADWVVGINATRALTCKHNAQLSCGRVQTPTLAILADRQKEIQQFQPKTYYGLSADAQNLKLLWRDPKTNSTRSFDQQGMEQKQQSLLGKKARITSVKKTAKTTLAPGLYDLTLLQREANSRFGFSAKETLSYLQKLYEEHKVLTYPRTDSKHLSSDMIGTLKERIKACSIGPYATFAGTILRQGIKTNKSFVDDRKVTDHHAIIPTEESPFLSELRDGERKIYDMVLRRFLSVFYPPFVYDETLVEASIGDETFIARGKVIKDLGWKSVMEKNKSGNSYDSDDLEEESLETADSSSHFYPEQVLPVLEKGQELLVKQLKLTTGKTKPPPFFTEGTLLAAMENPGKYMVSSDKDLKKTLQETGGLGTVATRGDIIEKLQKSFLMEKRGNALHLTSKGRQLLELVPEKMKSPLLTAQWEQRLSAIASGKLTKTSFVSDMREYAKTIVREIGHSTTVFKHDNVSREKCPECGKYLLEVQGKKGKMLVCQDRECGHRKSVALVTNARCPECRKKLELRGEGDGRIFVCRCGYREKLSVFEARKKKQGHQKVSKKEVNRYLKEQEKKKDEPINTALADALSKFTFDD